MALVLAVAGGSVPGLTLTRDGTSRLQAWDGDGELLWSADQLTGWSLLLDGRLHVSHEAGTVTFDARSGAELWRSSELGGAVVTDGRHQMGLATTPDRDDGPELLALDPVDGSQAWRSPVPEGSDLVQPVLNLLVVFDLGPAEGNGPRLTVQR